MAWPDGPWGMDLGDGRALPRLSRQSWFLRGSVVGGLLIGAGLRAAAAGHSDLRRFLAQVDEETALEQAVKFCQVHLGAAAQRQVSLSQPVLTLLCRACPTPRPQAAGKEVGTPQEGTVPVVSGSVGLRGDKQGAAEPWAHREPLTTSPGRVPLYSWVGPWQA